jgi:signal transduction histidine kinase
LRDDAFALHWADVPLETLVREAADIVIWSSKNSLVTDFSAAPAMWRCDPALLRIAVSNLLDNAVKYGGPGEVRILVAESNGELLIEVSDQGQGIPEADRVRVFERYQRGDNVPEGKGGGLGLAVSQMVAHAHGGSIQLMTKETPGCLFVLRLPRRRNEDAQP